MINKLGLQQGQQPLTSCEAKDRHGQHARIVAGHHSHSLPGEPRTGNDQQARIAARHTPTHFLKSQEQAMISRLELQQGTTATHQLESQGQA